MFCRLDSGVDHRLVPVEDEASIALLQNKERKMDLDRPLPSTYRRGKSTPVYQESEFSESISTRFASSLNAVSRVLIFSS